MPVIISSAPGKTILFGEHAVVYGQPAIAMPVREIEARVRIYPSIGVPSETIQFIASQIQLDREYKELEANHPLKIALDEVKKYLQIDQYPSCKIQLNSSIPISSGLGSSAAISVALIKALFDYVGFPSTPEIISKLAFQVEIEFHGNPSGIDNTVIAFNKPIIFQKEKPVETIIPGDEFVIIIADSGVKGYTKIAVSEVREHWQKNTSEFDAIFLEIGNLVLEAKNMMEKGNHIELGKLMNINHEYLTKIGVSHPSLEKLIEAARKEGALGAKLCGAGMGGNIIALAQENNAAKLSETLMNSGATQTIIMRLNKDFSQ